MRQNIKSVIKYNVLFLFACCNCVSVTPKIYIFNMSSTDHLKSEKIKDICGKINYICAQSSMKLCTLRMVDGKLEFKEFENHCYLFLYNMCQYPNNEWAIKDVGSCKHLNLRRFAEVVEKSNFNVTNGTDSTTQTADITGLMTDQHNETMTDKSNVTDNNTEVTTDENTALTSGQTNATDAALQSATKHNLRSETRSTYSAADAPDGHLCPYHCPDVYSPVCTNVNRGFGKHYKLLFFVNHCEADRHYCMYWDTVYLPPPGEYEMVNRPSNAAWSYCAGNKYMNFATFAESAWSMGHYGWLLGDQKPSHIMEPYERVPGFG